MNWRTEAEWKGAKLGTADNPNVRSVAGALWLRKSASKLKPDFTNSERNAATCQSLAFHEN
jgi:hypothetical protein